MTNLFLFFLAYLMINRIISPVSLFVSAIECSQTEITDVRFIRDTLTGSQTVELGFPGLDQHVFVSVGRPAVSATSTISTITTTPTADPTTITQYTTATTTTEYRTATTTDTSPTSYIERDYCSVVCRRFSQSVDRTLESDLCGPAQSYCESGFCTHLYLVPLDDGSGRQGLINSEIESDLTDEEMSNPLPCYRALEVVTVSTTELTTEPNTEPTTEVTTAMSSTEATTAFTEATTRLTTAMSFTEATTEVYTQFRELVSYAEFFLHQ